MKIDSLDSAVISLLSGMEEPASAWELAKELNKIGFKNIYYEKIRARCDKLAKQGILKVMDGDKGRYFEINTEQIVCSNGMTMFRPKKWKYPIILGCPFASECDRKTCKLGDMLPKEVIELLTGKK